MWKHCVGEERRDVKIKCIDMFIYDIPVKLHLSLYVDTQRGQSVETAERQAWISCCCCCCC